MIDFQDSIIKAVCQSHYRRGSHKTMPVKWSVDIKSSGDLEMETDLEVS